MGCFIHQLLQSDSIIFHFFSISLFNSLQFHGPSVSLCLAKKSIEQSSSEIIGSSIVCIIMPSLNVIAILLVPVLCCTLQMSCSYCNFSFLVISLSPTISGEGLIVHGNPFMRVFILFSTERWRFYNFTTSVSLTSN